MLHCWSGCVNTFLFFFFNQKLTQLTLLASYCTQLLFTPWILAQKWYKRNMSLEKIYFALWMKRKLGKRNFWNCTLSFWGLSWTAPIRPAGWAGWPMHFRWQLKRTMHDFKNSFVPNFLLIHRAKYIFSRDMFYLYHFGAKIHGLSLKINFEDDCQFSPLPSLGCIKIFSFSRFPFDTLGFHSFLEFLRVV